MIGKLIFFPNCVSLNKVQAFRTQSLCIEGMDGTDISLAEVIKEESLTVWSERAPL